MAIVTSTITPNINGIITTSATTTTTFFSILNITAPTTGSFRNRLFGILLLLPELMSFLMILLYFRLLLLKIDNGTQSTTSVAIAIFSENFPAAGIIIIAVVFLLLL